MRKTTCIFMLGVFVLLAGLVATASGDTLVLKSGKTYEGKIVSQNSRGVVFLVHKYGNTFEKTFKHKDVESLTTGKIVKKSKKKKTADSKKARSGKKDLKDIPKPEAPEIKEYDTPTYYVIPLKGMVGKTFVASVLEESLEDAVQREPTVVILDMDSSGGLASEVDKLGDVLTRYKDSLRIVVLAKDAISAAAITSLAVDEIYLRPGGRIGAATAWRMAPDGTPAAVSEKFESCFRAKARNLAEIGGHSPLFADAMISASVELHWVLDEDGNKVVKEGPAKGESKICIIKKGKLLMMTTKESVDCGLVDGTAKNYDALGKQLGYEKWQECEGLGVPLAKWQDESLKVAEAKFKKNMGKFEKAMSRAVAMDPNNTNYTVYRNSNGHFTPASQTKWKKRCRTCLANLNIADKKLEKMKELAKTFPGLLTDPDQLENMQKRIDDKRQQIKADYNAKGRTRQ